MFPQHKCYTSNSSKYARAGLHHKSERFIYLFYRIKSPGDYPKSTWISWVEKPKWVLCISKQTCTNTLAVSTPMAPHQRRDQSDFTSGVEYIPWLKETRKPHLSSFQILEIIQLGPYATNTPSGPRHDFKTLFNWCIERNTGLLYFYWQSINFLMCFWKNKCTITLMKLFF